jgi:glucose/arabinose dehydrogenase
MPRPSSPRLGTTAAATLALAALAALGCAPRATERAADRAAAVAAAAGAPDSTRFQQQVLLQGVFDEPTEIAVARDGRVFVTERKGTLRVYDPRAAASGAEPTRVVAQLDVFTENENGLLGVALDPRFDQNGWLYVARSVGDTTNIRHRLSRFATGDHVARLAHMADSILEPVGNAVFPERALDLHNQRSLRYQSHWANQRDRPAQPLFLLSHRLDVGLVRPFEGPRRP